MMEPEAPVNRLNLLVAMVTGVAATGLVWLFRYPVVNPAIWEDVAAGAGIRPPMSLLGGLARAVYATLFALFPSVDMSQVVLVGGWVSAAVIGFLAYCVIWNLSQPWIDHLADGPGGCLMARSVVAFGTILFVCSESVWVGVQALSPLGVTLTLLLSGAWLTLRFLHTSYRRYAVAAIAVWAFTAGESPAGYFGVLIVLAFALRRKPESDEEGLALENPLMRLFFRRLLAFGFFAALIAALVVEFRMFDLQGGIYPGDTPVENFVALYMGEIWRTLRTGVSMKCGMLLLVSVGCPLVVARYLFRRGLQEDKFLTTRIILLNGAVGLLAWMQVGGIESMHCGSWVSDSAALSPLLRAFAALMSVTTLVWMALVLGARLFLSSAGEIAIFRYEDAEETPSGHVAVSGMTRADRWLRPAVIALAVVIPCLAVALRFQSTPRAMLALIGEYLTETVRECDGLEHVITDGSLDAGLELESRRRGGTELKAMAMMGGHSERDIFLRQRGFVAEDDIESLRVGVSNALRTWFNDKDVMLDGVALQLGFDRWQTVKAARHPVVCGTIARMAADEAELARTREWARDFAARILSLYGTRNPDGIADRKIRETFRYVQWRVARFCQYRAAALGTKEWGEESKREQALADALDKANQTYAELKRQTARSMSINNLAMTPRECLRICLERADFTSAYGFAERVAASDPDDPRANFALGMYHFLDENYARAEPFLRRCLVRNPGDPAVLNNLAVIQMRLGRFDEAEKTVAEALARLPDSPHIKKTVEAIKKSRLERTRLLEERK